MKIKPLKKGDFFIDKKLKKTKNYLLKNLESYGVLHWYTASSGKSVYLKFKDHRLGTIRISNHKNVRQEHYAWDLNYLELNKYKLDKIIEQVGEKSKKIPKFNPNKFMVYNQRVEKTVCVQTFSEYRKITMHPMLY